jgi:hypothetical protein
MSKCRCGAVTRSSPRVIHRLLAAGGKQIDRPAERPDAWQKDMMGRAAGWSSKGPELLPSRPLLYEKS